MAQERGTPEIIRKFFQIMKQLLDAEIYEELTKEWQDQEDNKKSIHALNSPLNNER